MCNANATTTIHISTAHNSLFLQVAADGRLVQTYYGTRLEQPEEYPYIATLDTFIPGSDDLYNQREAYVSSGALNLLEPALTAIHADGNQATVLHYVRHEVAQLDHNLSHTRIYLKDPRYDFFVTLHYKAYAAEDVIEQWTEISHNEAGNVQLDKYASANLTLQANRFFLQSHHSGWGREMQRDEEELKHGIRTLDSKLGTRNNLLLSSSFMLALAERATETSGEVIAGSLAWTGNFRLDFEPFDENYLRITAGINNFASAYTLAAGDTFSSPAFIHTFSGSGKGQASRNLHAWARNYRLPQGNGPRLTLLNNWEATYFDFDENKLKGLVKDAKRLGVDVFLLDDGWFGNKYPRDAANAALGDWQPNKKKLPNGFAALIKEATKNDVKFGIWLEPEMVSPKSACYEQHPEWVVRQPQLPEYYMRNQLVLDLGNPEVQDFVFHTVDEMLQENPDIAFIKWDCNSLIYNAHSSHNSNQSHFYIAYTQGLYSVLERVRAKHASIPIMLCAGGGSRVDYGALKYFSEFWPSDNTNAFDRIFIQWEYSNYFPAISIDNHVTDMGKQPIKFKVDVAFMGKLGFDIRVDELPETDLLFAQQAVKTYDKLKKLIWTGDLYRLQDPYQHKAASVAYVATDKDTALLCNYHMPTTYTTTILNPIKMQGLDAKKKYKIEEINLYPGTHTPIDASRTYSGDFLMKIGFNPQTSSKRSSVLLLVTAIP